MLGQSKGMTTLQVQVPNHSLSMCDLKQVKTTINMKNKCVKSRRKNHPHVCSGYLSGMFTGDLKLFFVLLYFF